MMADQYNIHIVGVDPTNKNGKTLLDFIEYCRTHPEYRFWQALRNWARVPFIFMCAKPPETFGYNERLLHDTFHREGK